MSIDESLIQKIQVQVDSVFAEMKSQIKSLRDQPELLDNTLNSLWYEFYDEFICFGSRLADLHLILPNEVPQLSC
ncbi:hypothetical protein [Acinetobacter sp. YH01020]|uniref:hypothetical protein n=1 Tax=Acinetobacter sp. YH01020 TaxID=2601034 RepID=UPI0015D41934|nr:hypothetical protein [Acinetobacter sp. YH01020]